MRTLILLLAVMVVLCNKQPKSSTAPLPDGPVLLTAVAGSKALETPEVSILCNHDLIAYGKLPHTVEVAVGDSLVAEFIATVSNFGQNHPQCSCTQTAYARYECAEPWVVQAGDSLWEVGK